MTDETQNYFLPVKYREKCNVIDIFSLDLSNNSSLRRFKLSIKLTSMPKHYNIELIKNSLEILQRTENDLSQHDQQQLFNQLFDYLAIKQEHSVYSYMIYTSLATIYSSWLIVAAASDLSVILAGSLLFTLIFIGVETLIAVSIGLIIGYFIYKNIHHLIQTQMEKKLSDSLVIYKSYLDAIDSFSQPITNQRSEKITHFFAKKNYTRIRSNTNAEPDNFVLIAAQPS